MEGEKTREQIELENRMRVLEGEVNTGKENIELKALSTILDEGVDFEVTYKTKNILHKLKILKPSRKFRIYRIHLNPLLNISKILMEMDIKTIEDDGQLFQLGLDYIVKYKDSILRIISYAIINRKLTLWNKLRRCQLERFLNNNLNADELLKLIILVTTMMGVKSFLASIVSINQINLIGTMKNHPTSGKSSGA